MSKIIEAKATISAEDKTGRVFDNISQKMRGVEKTATAMEGIKAPQFVGKFNDELQRLKLSEKELQGVRRSFTELDRVLKSGGPIGAANYFRSIEGWKQKTVGHWREVKASVDEAGDAHKRFFKGAGKFGLHMLGVAGGAYVAGHAAKEVIKTASDRQRERVRYEQMGMSPEEEKDGEGIASDISSKYPAISRTEVLADLRKNTSRLGSFDRAKEIADTYARAKISNKLSGGDEHELEQVVRAAEGAGAANTPEQFREFMDGFAKAKAATPDYTGDQLRSDFAAAGSSKYGWNTDFRENVFPVLASHTSGFGNKMGTLNSALVGGRMTKKSRAALQAAGLLDKNGHVIDEAAPGKCVRLDARSYETDAGGERGQIQRAYVRGG